MLLLSDRRELAGLVSSYAAVGYPPERHGRIRRASRLNGSKLVDRSIRNGWELSASLGSSACPYDGCGSCPHDRGSNEVIVAPDYRLYSVNNSNFSDDGYPVVGHLVQRGVQWTEPKVETYFNPLTDDPGELNQLLRPSDQAAPKQTVEQIISEATPDDKEPYQLSEDPFIRSIEEELITLLYEHSAPGSFLEAHQKRRGKELLTSLNHFAAHNQVNLRNFPVGFDALY